VVFKLFWFGVSMSREVKITATQDSDISGTLKQILKELKKMNLYLALMTDLVVTNEDVEE